MSFIIDRRLNAKKKSTINRQRFLRRYKEHIKKAVSDAVDKRSITDMDKGEKISIPTKNINEPFFHHGEGGKNTKVLPGNDQFHQGDEIQRPPGGAGDGGNGSGASDSGDGEDEFAFNISQEEFLNFMFEDLELPNLVKRQLTESSDFSMRRAGFSNEGSPGKINIVRSLKSANARRIAVTSKKRRQLEELKKALEDAEKNNNLEKIVSLKQQIEDIKRKIKRVPWLDDFDLKYNLLVKQPNPQAKAVMFCLMDVSGSMDQTTKDIAKRFFLLLYLFLQRSYEHTEVVFIRHHTSAKEVDEEEFFYSRETGGTIVSSALNLTKEIIQKRYPSEQWNIYTAQASDGDNWNNDSDICSDLLKDSLIPIMQYFAYIEITDRDHQALWTAYKNIESQFPDKFAMRNIQSAADIFPVFRQFFEKEKS